MVAFAEAVTPWLFAFGITLIVLSLIGERYIKEVRGWIGERRVRKIIEASGLRSVHDYYCVDAQGVPTQIDHLVHLGESIAVIETKNFISTKAIYAGAGDKTWTHGWGKFRRKFQNPIRQNFRHVRTLQETHPGITFEGLVCFISGRFPKGMPEGVVNGPTLASALAQIDRLPSVEKTAIDHAWDHIERMRATQTKHDRIAHRKSLRERFSPKAELDRR